MGYPQFGAKNWCAKTSPLTPLPLRFRLRLARATLDVAREILAERGGRAPHASALTSNRGLHRRIAHVSERRRRSSNRITADSPKKSRLRISASPREIPRPPHSPRSPPQTANIPADLRGDPQSGANFDSRFSSREATKNAKGKDSLRLGVWGYLGLVIPSLSCSQVTVGKSTPCGNCF